MKISQNLESFRLFAETMKASGKESSVIRATEASVFGVGSRMKYSSLVNGVSATSLLDGSSFLRPLKCW